MAPVVVEPDEIPPAADRVATRFSYIAEEVARIGLDIEGVDPDE